MADISELVEQAEDMAGLLKKTVAEYEATLAAMERLTEEAKREIQRYDELKKNEDLKLDWAVDLFLEASELKLAMLDIGSDLEDACDDLLGFNTDYADLSTYPSDFQTILALAPAVVRRKFNTRSAEIAAEMKAEGPKDPRPKRRRGRMSV